MSSSNSSNRRRQVAAASPAAAVVYEAPPLPSLSNADYFGKFIVLPPSARDLPFQEKMDFIITESEKGEKRK